MHNIRKNVVQNLQSASFCVITCRVWRRLLQHPNPSMSSSSQSSFNKLFSSVQSFPSFISSHRTNSALSLTTPPSPFHPLNPTSSTPPARPHSSSPRSPCSSAPAPSVSSAPQSQSQSALRLASSAAPRTACRARLAALRASSHTSERIPYYTRNPCYISLSLRSLFGAHVGLRSRGSLLGGCLAHGDLISSGLTVGRNAIVTMCSRMKARERISKWAMLFTDVVAISRLKLIKRLGPPAPQAQPSRQATTGAKAR
jgi:hypothetical protein